MPLRIAILEPVQGANAMKILLTLSFLVVVVSFCGFHGGGGCFPGIQETPRKFCKKNRSLLESTKCLEENEIRGKLFEDECVVACVRSEPAFSLIDPCITLGLFTAGFGEHAPFGLHQFLTRPYMEYAAAYLEAFGEALIALCEGVGIADTGLDFCTELCGKNSSSNVTKKEETKEKLKKVMEILDALETTLETAHMMNVTDPLSEDSEFKKFEADITDQLKYNDLMVQTHLMTKLFAKAEAGKKLFTKILMKKAEGKHGINWVLWMWDELIRELIQKRPDFYCPKFPAYLIKQLKMRNVATFVKVRQTFSTERLHAELENLKHDFKKTQEGQDKILRQNCLKTET